MGKKIGEKELPVNPPSYEETLKKDARNGQVDNNRFSHIHVPIKTAKSKYPAGGTYTYSNNK
ncbi:hypothetical protein RNJ44_01203 [Nakaseomyces bracarensis]|uniref:Uncharacterized protein n=1 Tax=Nakaseomyces bracarensis TaxID=273131 RepID=A0ABR4NR82_9SACH